MNTIDQSGWWTKISVVLTVLVLVFGIILTVVYGRSKSDDNMFEKGYTEYIDFSKDTYSELLSEILIRERVTHHYKNHDYIVHLEKNNGKLYYSHHNNFIRCSMCDKEKGIIKNEL